MYGQTYAKSPWQCCATQQMFLGSKLQILLEQFFFGCPHCGTTHLCFALAVEVHDWNLLGQAIIARDKGRDVRAVENHDWDKLILHLHLLLGVPVRK